MNAAKSESVKTICYAVKCATIGCLSHVNGFARAGEANAEGKAGIRARRDAREGGWEQRGGGAGKHWKCPGCVAREVRDSEEADRFDRIYGADRRTQMKASAAAREALAKRQTEREKTEARKTRPVGDKIAKADETLTKETPKLVYVNEFERVVVRHLQARQVTAADEWRRQIEASEGVSDREIYGERVDKSVGPGHPSLSQLAALEWRAKVQTHIGAENVAILDKAIKHDRTPKQIGADYCNTRDDKKRAMVGTAFIKAALTQLADYMGLRG